jgi:hypothetical protein
VKHEKRGFTVIIERDEAKSLDALMKRVKEALSRVGGK